MAKISIYINAEMERKLDKIKKNSGKSLSKITSDLIETGYKVMELKKEQEGNPQNKLAELEAKKMEYMLRLISITSDTYRHIRNEKSKYDAQDADGAINQMIDNVKAYIQSLLQKNQ